MFYRAEVVQDVPNGLLHERASARRERVAGVCYLYTCKVLQVVSLLLGLLGGTNNPKSLS
jgi:hypothetical protein